jgi:hypothetical protein
MKIQIMNRRFGVSALAVPVLAVLSGVVVRGFNPQPDPPRVFGMVGITPYETARINVVVLADGAAPATGCRVAFGYFNKKGRVLKQDLKTILPGHGEVFDLVGVEALPTGPIKLRTEIRPVAELAPTTTDPCHIAATFELFDNVTGKASIVATQPATL